MRRSRVLTAVAVVTSAVVVVGMPGTAEAAPAEAAPGYDAAVSTPQEDPYYPDKGDPGVDALHYGLRLHWAPRTRVLSGVATIRFRATDDDSQVQLDLGSPLQVRRVSLDGRSKPFRHPGNHLVVQTGSIAADSRHTLVVSYRGTPRRISAPSTRKDVLRLGWATTARGEVWTMQEPFGAFTWYLVNDHPSDKAFCDARISVPRGMVRDLQRPAR